MATPRKQGAVTNNYSNLVVGIAIDASVARGWQGYDHPGYEELTEKLFEGEEARIELDGVSGVLLDIGGCGSSDVFALDADDIVLLEHYSDDWNPDIEEQFLGIVASPLREEAERVGTFEVTSGVLALLHAGDPGEEIADHPQVQLGATEEVEGGVLLGVPNGSYEIWKEKLDAEGGWGTIETRIRIVRDVARARAPKEKRVTPAARSVSNVARSFHLPEGMGYVASLELSNDGAWLAAGEKSGPNIAVWSTAKGELAWTKSLAPRADSHEYTQNVLVSIHGSRIAAVVRDKLFVLDGGRVLAEHSLGPGETPFAKMIQASCSFVRFTPDGERLLVGKLPNVLVVEWKTGNEPAVIENCSSVCNALHSPDGSLLALPGYVLQFCDARTLAVVRRVELEDHATAAAFSPDGQTILVASGGVVSYFDVPEGTKAGALPGASSVRAVDVQDIAWHGDRIATASEDGYVRIWNAATHEVVQEFPGHDTTIPGTGARSLHGLSFSPDGRALYVGGAPPGKRAVTAYSIGDA